MDEKQKIKLVLSWNAIFATLVRHKIYQIDGVIEFCEENYGSPLIFAIQSTLLQSGVATETLEADGKSGEQTKISLKNLEEYIHKLVTRKI